MRFVKVGREVEVFTREKERAIVHNFDRRSREEKKIPMAGSKGLLSLAWVKDALSRPGVATVLDSSAAEITPTTAELPTDHLVR